MVPAVRVKPGTEFAVIQPGGFALLSAIWAATQVLGHDLTITSGTDGTHSGLTDPHHDGRAYDIRTKGIDAMAALTQIMAELLADNKDVITPSAGGYVTRYFFGWIEDVGNPNEHIHVQVRKGLTYPPGDATTTT